MQPDLTPTDINIIHMAVEQMMDRLHRAVLDGQTKGWRDSQEKDRILTYIHQTQQVRHKIKSWPIDPTTETNT